MSRMSNLARQEMYFQYFFSMQEVIDMVEQVTAEQVHGDGGDASSSRRIGRRNPAGPSGRPEGEPQPVGVLSIPRNKAAEVLF